MKIVYSNTEGNSIELGQTAPFLVTAKIGFASTENLINSQKQYGLDGEYFISQNLAKRSLEIDGEILSGSAAGLDVLRRQMVSTFNPLIAGTLTYYDDSGGAYSIDCLPDFAPSFDKQQTGTLPYVITLVALDPFWTDLSNEAQNVVLSSVVNKFKFPLSLTSSFIFAEIQAGQIIEIDNTGDVPTGVVISLTMTGAVTNPKIIDIETQQFFGFNGTFNSGTTLIIDTRKGSKSVTQTINGVTTNAMSLRMAGSTFLQLSKGPNFIELQSASGLNALVGTLQFQPLVLGV